MCFFCKGRHVVHIRLSHCYSQQEGLEIQCFILLLLLNQLETGVRKQWSARQSLLPVSKFIFPTTKQEPFSFSLEISVKNSGFCSSHRRLTLSIGICCLSSLVIACSHTSHTNGPVLCLWDERLLLLSSKHVCCWQGRQMPFLPPENRANYCKWLCCYLDFNLAHRQLNVILCTDAFVKMIRLLKIVFVWKHQTQYLGISI